MQDATNKNVSRRSLIKAAAGLGAGAAIGLPAVVFLTRGDQDMAPAVSASGKSGVAAGQPIVAYVRDAAAGEVVVMFGSGETVVTDRQLVDRLAGLVRG